MACVRDGTFVRVKRPADKQVLEFQETCLRVKNIQHAAATIKSNILTNTLLLNDNRERTRD